jgi:hypothetical protein
MLGDFPSCATAAAADVSVHGNIRRLAKRFLQLGISVFLSGSFMTMEGCRDRVKPLSPCRARVLEHAKKYVNDNVPDIQWQPVIEAEMAKCIEEEKSK